MTNGIDKKALFKLKSEPYLKPISDLGVGFYNLDENTAILRFQLSNRTSPLSVSEENLVAYAYFESSNGSVSDVIELEIEDSLNGIVTITLDKEFLQASTSTKVKGQVYIAVNNVDGNPEYNEVAVFREFTFEVADALINKISSFTKVEYIRMFSQLKMKIEQQVKDIEDAIANGADYVAEMKSVRQEGIETLNAIVTNGKTDIQAYIAQAKTDLTKVKDGATEDITTVANNAKSSVQDTASTAVNSINTKTTEATEHVDNKVTEFNQTVEANGFVTPEKLTEDLTSLEWQKYKLTNDNGTVKDFERGMDLEDEDFLDSLSTGFYYLPSPINPPVGYSGFLTVYERHAVKVIYFQPYNQDKLSINRYYQKWSGWKELTDSYSDTGWIPFNLINGALSNTAYKSSSDNGFDCAYRIIVNGSVTTRKLRINGTNITPGQTLINLPSSFCKNTQTFPVRIPIKYSGGCIVIRPSGEVKFFVNGDDTAWVSTDYAYGEMSWSD